MDPLKELKDAIAHAQEVADREGYTECSDQHRQLVKYLTQLLKLQEDILNKSVEEIPSDEDDFMADDYAGGNIDDAWSGGEREGQVYYARHLRTVMEAV